MSLNCVWFNIIFMRLTCVWLNNVELWVEFLHNLWSVLKGSLSHMAFPLSESELHMEEMHEHKNVLNNRNQVSGCLQKLTLISPEWTTYLVIIGKFLCLHLIFSTYSGLTIWYFIPCFINCVCAISYKQSKSGKRS